ncbi:MAG: hypothetical protein KDE03_15210 [Rhodobacteraceae bacterium]|nr:hypothetical protein [Paracoccaceae bacterium]
MAGFLAEQRPRALFATALASAVVTATMGLAMGDTAKPAFRVACALPGGAEAITVDICAAFLDRLARLEPPMALSAVPPEEAADIRLVVDAASAGRISARVIRQDAEAPPRETALGIARADAPLDAQAIGAFLDQLIADAFPR